MNVDERGDLLGEFTSKDRLLIANQKGNIKTIIPDLNTHFDSDMIVLEKWIPNKPISVVYFDGEKQRYYVKRFMIDNPNKEESFISEHPNSQLEIVSTDYRPMAEVIFSKKSLENIELNFEDFIAIKGIKALGNQLTTDKIKQINLLESLAYEEPEINDVDLVEEEVVVAEDEEQTIIKKPENKSSKKEDGQIDLFIEEDN